MKTNMKKSIFALITAAMLAVPTIGAFAAGEPANVTGLTATAVDATSIGLSWNSAKDAGGNAVNHYRVYYGTTSVQTVGEGDYDTQVDTPNNNNSYVVTGLTPSTAYYFSVTAIDAASLESEAYSLEANATTSAVGGAGTDTTSPTVTEVTAVDKAHVKVVFSEAVKLPDLLPEAAFTIEEQLTPTKLLEVMGAKLDQEDVTGSTIILETAAQTKSVNYIVTAGVAITDTAGNPIISGSTDSGLFAGSDVEPPVTESAPVPLTEEVAPAEGATAVCGNGTVEEGEACDDGNVKSDDGCSATCVVDKDITPPEDITSLILSFKRDLEKFIIVMNWTASINTAKDLVDQILYQSLDRGTTYDTGTPLGAEATTNEVPNLEGGKEYTFKITTKDAAGNESVGVVKSIRLPQTGIGISLLLFGSAAAAGLIRRKQK
jgi:cysteine-rich repeat protein